jgi:hypothetical protein
MLQSERFYTTKTQPGHHDGAALDLEFGSRLPCETCVAMITLGHDRYVWRLVRGKLLDCHMERICLPSMIQSRPWRCRAAVRPCVWLEKKQKNASGDRGSTHKETDWAG